MHKTYLSVAVSRAWSAEMPVGDPLGGPAYGERNMPLVAVVAAIGAAGTIATVGLAAMTAFEVVAAVGAITAGIGAVTGNEKLMKLGGIMGLAGGVGAFAESQGWIGGEAAMSGTEAAASPATQSAQASNVVDAAGGNIAEVAQGGADVAKTIESAATTPGVEQITEAAQGGGLMAPKVDGGLQAPSAASAAPTTSVPGEFVNESQKLMQQQNLAQAGVNQLNTNLPTVDVNGKPAGFLDAFKNVGKWMEENKQLTSIGAAFVGGMFDEEKEAKANAYNAQSDLIRQQMDNMSRMPTARLMQPVTPQTPVPQKTGLMRPKG